MLTTGHVLDTWHSIASDECLSSNWSSSTCHHLLPILNPWISSLGCHIHKCPKSPITYIGPLHDTHMLLCYTHEPPSSPYRDPVQYLTNGSRGGLQCGGCGVQLPHCSEGLCRSSPLCPLCVSTQPLDNATCECKQGNSLLESSVAWYEVSAGRRSLLVCCVGVAVVGMLAAVVLWSKAGRAPEVNWLLATVRSKTNAPTASHHDRALMAAQHERAMRKNTIITNLV